MKITAIEPRAVAEPGGRSYVIVKATTDEGLAGYGETAVGSDAQTTVDRLQRELASLVGANPDRTLLLDQQLIREDASSEARAAIAMAAWDLIGKSAQAPLYEVLGGPTRNKARAMAVVRAESADDTHAAVLEAKAAGHRAFSVLLDLPSGLERGRAFYLGVRSFMDSLRQAAGEECDFVLDCSGRTTPGEAVSIADRMEDFHLLWLDEPTGDLNAESQASISAHSVTPIGFGREFVHNSRFQDLLREDGIDVLRPDLAKTTITNIRKAAAIAEAYYIALSPFHRGGPIAAAAGVHISASLPNSFIQETPYSRNVADRRMREELSGWNELPANGFFPLLEGPGLGLQVNESVLERYTIAR